MIFERIIVGVDGSEEGYNACRLATRLRAPTGNVLAIAVAETAYAVHAGADAAEWTWRLRARAETTGERILRDFEEYPRVQARVEVGYAAPVLLATAAAEHADLIAIGRHGLGRAAGILLGSVATRVIHDAPCSVLVTHTARGPRCFPRLILVGVDGSDAAAEAEAVAELIAEGSGTHVHRLLATGEHGLPNHLAVRAELDPRDPVEALVDHSSSFDLLVVGSRGRRGLASLGSVAERVAHEAHCPLLIVRQPPLANTSSASLTALRSTLALTAQA